jgi:uncharacterized protein YsxB (DUF464 family)
MTEIVIVRKNNRINHISCSGHTGYGIEGEDIVCAAISSIVQTALLGLLQVSGINVKFTRNDEKGLLDFSLPEGLSERQKIESNAILETMLCGIEDLSTEYSDYIKLEVR